MAKVLIRLKMQNDTFLLSTLYQLSSRETIPFTGRHGHRSRVMSHGPQRTKNMTKRWHVIRWPVSGFDCPTWLLISLVNCGVFRCRRCHLYFVWNTNYLSMAANYFVIVTALSSSLLIALSMHMGNQVNPDQRKWHIFLTWIAIFISKLANIGS